ncbi:hypothetical protein KJ695_00790 [Patescibacteria group bacterium]|nr:hypothetical protein [Patescibacteria group bacterium]
MSTKKNKKIVIKIGSRCIADGYVHPTTGHSYVDWGLLERITGEIKKLRDEGWQVILVVSGAINAGAPYWNFKQYSNEPLMRKISASLGQALMMRYYASAFGYIETDNETNLPCQILVTYDQLKNPKIATALKETLKGIMDERMIPIINYNDPLSVAVKEIKIWQKLKNFAAKLCRQESVGAKTSRFISDYKLEEELFKDNDCLAAIIAVLLEASHLLILTDKVEGLMDNGELIRYASLKDIGRYKEICAGKGGEFNTGGMLTKLIAAEIVLSEDITVIIGNIKYNTIDLINNEKPHTRIEKYYRVRMVSKKLP